MAMVVQIGRAQSRLAAGVDRRNAWQGSGGDAARQASGPGL